MAEEESDDGIAAMGKKLGDNDFYRNEAKSPSSSPSSVSQENQTSMVKKGKSCKGCLYYSSAIKSKSGQPLCVGLTRSFPSDSSNIYFNVGGIARVGIKPANLGSAPLSEFKYGCIGYSVYHGSPGLKNRKAQLPACFGLEILSEIERPVTAAAESASTQPRKKEDVTLIPPPAPITGSRKPAPTAPTPALATGSRKPAPLFESKFLNRFTRSAGLVAKGVAKNLKRVGNEIKTTVDDVLYPYRRRPK